MLTICLSITITNLSGVVPVDRFIYNYGKEAKDKQLLEELREKRQQNRLEDFRQRIESDSNEDDDGEH